MFSTWQWCSSRSSKAVVPIFQCRHQCAVDALIRQQWLSSLVRRGLFRYPERLTLEFERQQRRLLKAFSPPCAPDLRPAPDHQG